MSCSVDNLGEELDMKHPLGYQKQCVSSLYMQYQLEAQLHAEWIESKLYVYPPKQKQKWPIGVVVLVAFVINSLGKPILLGRAVPQGLMPRL